MRATVSGKELKSIFIDISALLKKYDRAKVVGIETTHTTMTFTVDTGTCYTRTVDIKPVADAMNLSVTVLFADLSHFISAREDVMLDISQYFMTITTSKSTLTLTIGDSIVTPYEPRKGKIVDLDYGVLRKAVKVFSGTQDLQKAYSRDFALSFYGDWALMKSPTVWIQTRSQALRCVLSLEQAKSIVAFQPEFVEESDRLEFHKGKAILSIPRLTPTEANRFDEFKNKMRLTSVFVMEGIVRELTEVKRAIGVAEAEIHLHEVGFHLKINKGGVVLEEAYQVSGDSVFSFRCMFDIFTMAISLLGEEKTIKIYTKEDMVCLESQDTSILLSV